MVTELLYLTDAYLAVFDATVVDVRDGAVALDRTAFYPTGGGQPHDTGKLGDLAVVDVRKEGDHVWHSVEGAPLPSVGDSVNGVIDWPRRHQLMRTHSALHVLCGVIWNEWRVPVTGGNMEPLSARMDFDLAEVPADFKDRVAAACNAEIAEDRRIEVSVLPREEAFAIPDIIRTATNLLPDDLQEVRIVDITGLDVQADGGTHVASTAMIGRVEVVKMENKGRGFRRLRVRVI